MLKPIYFRFPLKASKGKLEVECNPKLSTTTTFTTPATSAGDVITSKHTNSPNNTNNHTSGGHGHGNNIKTTNIPGKKDPGRIFLLNYMYLLTVLLSNSFILTKPPTYFLTHSFPD